MCSFGMYRKSLVFRIYILAFVIVLPFIALLGFVYSQRYETRKSQAVATELEVARGIESTLSVYFHGVQKTNLSLGRAIELLPDAGSITRLLIGSMADSETLISLSYIGPSGTVFASTAHGLVGKNVSSRTFFGQMRSVDSFLEDLSPHGMSTSGPTFVYATAVRGRGGAFKGCIAAEIDPSRLGHVIQDTPRPVEGSVTVFDGKGMVVFDTLNFAIGWETRSGWAKNDAVLARSLITGATESGEILLNPGYRCIAVVVPVDGILWKAEARRPWKAAFSAVRSGTAIDLIIAAIVMGFAFMAAWLLGRNITIPLFRLRNDAMAMCSTKSAPTADPSAPTEIAELRQMMLTLLNDLNNHAHELEASKTLLTEIFENVYDGIIIHDLDGRIVQVNKRWLKLFDVRDKDVPGLTIKDISCDISFEGSVTEMWNDVMRGETKLIEWCCRRPRDRSTFDAEVFLYPIVYEEQKMIMGCVRDITERKRWAQEQQRYQDELEQRVKERTEDLTRAFSEIQTATKQKLAAVEDLRQKEQLLIHQSRLAAMGEMLGNIAHQWRQPLNILGLVIQEIAFSFRSGALTKSQLDELAEKGMRIVKNMSQTIDDFRNLVGPGKVKERFGCREVVDKVLSISRVQAEVVVQADDDCCSIVGIQSEFAHVIVNILNNANEVLQDRKIENPRIVIRLFCEDDKSVITVTDNGGGIPEDVLPYIFDPYFTTKGPDKGTGIGLFMSKAIVQNMNGTLTARNTDDGVEFRIEVHNDE